MELNKINSSMTNWGAEAANLNENFDKVSTAIEQVKNATIKCKGYFSSESALKLAIPTAAKGDKAYVGNNYPYQIWIWNGSSWGDSGSVGGEESVNLGNYHTKEYTDAKLSELGSEVNKNSLGLNISSIEEEEDFNQYPLRLYTILDSGLYGSSSTYRHILIPVSYDECVSVQASMGNEAKLAWFKSNISPVKGGTPDYVDGTSLFKVSANTDAFFSVPKGANFLFVYLGSEGSYEYTPQYVKIRKAKIADNLESEEVDYALSAKQGKTLNGKILKNSENLERLYNCVVSNPDFNPDLWIKYTISGEVGETPTNGTSASFGRYEIELNGELYISVSVIGVIKTTQYVTFLDSNNTIIDKIDVTVSVDYERIFLDYIPVPSTAVKVAVNTYKDAGNVGENYVKVLGNLSPKVEKLETDMVQKEAVSNKKTDLSNPNDVNYPTTKATSDAIAESTMLIRAESQEVSSGMEFGKYVSASGTGFGYSEKRAASTNYYQVYAGFVYNITNNGNYKITIHTYKSDKEFIKMLGWFVDMKSFSVEQDGYIRVSVEDTQEINKDNYIPLRFERKSFFETAIESIEKINDEQNEEIKNIKSKVEQKNSYTPCPLSAIEKTIGIKKPYYFETLFSGYGIESLRPIDDMLDKVPKGKHFIVYTDSHISYNLYQHDGVACGWKNPVEPLINYAKNYLGGCKVVYGGDFIGNWLTGDVNPQGFVVNQYKYFANLCYGELGNDFLYCIGDHDTFNGGTEASYRPKVSEIHSIMFKNTQCVYDEDAFAAIDNCTFITSDEEREQLKSIFGMNYYIDDYTNKIRFIIFTSTGTGFTKGQDALDIDMGYSGAAFIPFIKKALQSVPEGFDVVLCGHEYGSGTASGYPLHLHINTNKFYTRTMYKLCLYFMRGETGSLNPFEYWSGTDHIFEVMKDLVTQLSGDNSTNVAYDFSNRKDRPKLFWCCGDKHIDAAGFLYGNGFSSTAEQEHGAKLDEFATDQSRNDGVLVLSFDRACITDQGSSAKKYYTDGYRDVWTSKNDNGDRNNTDSDWENTETNVWTKRHGTPKDVLFHVVTIGDDGCVTINRIGAEGIKYDGEGNIVETTMERKYRIPTGI